MLNRTVNNTIFDFYMCFKQKPEQFMHNHTIKTIVYFFGYKVSAVYDCNFLTQSEIQVTNSKYVLTNFVIFFH